MGGFLGEGTLFIDRYSTSGVAQGFVEAGNAVKFAIKEAGEIKERISRMKGSYGQVLDSVAIKKPAKISISMNDLKIENLAIALLGDISAIAVTGAALTDESLVASLDKWVETAQRNITAASVTVTDDPETAPYVEVTDYEVDYELGMIKALSTGAITEGEALLVDYTHGDIAGQKIAGSARPTIKCALKLNGKNLATDKDCLVNVFEAVLTPTAEVDFLADDFNEIGLEGTLNTPTGQAGPYEVEYID